MLYFYPVADLLTGMFFQLVHGLSKYLLLISSVSSRPGATGIRIKDSLYRQVLPMHLFSWGWV